MMLLRVNRDQRVGRSSHDSGGTRAHVMMSLNCIGCIRG